MTTKTWNALSKRGLALFLALVMCMGMLPLSVFAEEAGAVTGDSITMSEDMVTPVIDQETEEEVKTPAEETEEEVKTPAEETEEEVKTPAEETEEEVKTPAEETEEEVKTPAEETEEEVKTPAEGTEEEVKTPAKETEEEVKTPAEEAEEGVKTPAEETEEGSETSAEVQAFLDAVDAIEVPEEDLLLEENADLAEALSGDIWVAYGLWEELTEEQQAQEEVEIAFEELQNMLMVLPEYASSTYALSSISVNPDYDPNGCVPGVSKFGGSVTKNVGENGFYKRRAVKNFYCGTCGWFFGQSQAKEYANIQWEQSVDGVISDVSFRAGSLEGAPCLEMDFTGAQAGTTLVTIQYDVNFHTRWNAGGGVCPYGHGNYVQQYDDNWYHYVDTFYVTVVDDTGMNGEERWIYLPTTQTAADKEYDAGEIDLAWIRSDGYYRELKFVSIDNSHEIDNYAMVQVQYNNYDHTVIQCIITGKQTPTDGPIPFYITYQVAQYDYYDRIIGWSTCTDKINVVVYEPETVTLAANSTQTYNFGYAPQGNYHYGRYDGNNKPRVTQKTGNVSPTVTYTPTNASVTAFLSADKTYTVKAGSQTGTFAVRSIHDYFYSKNRNGGMADTIFEFVQRTNFVVTSDELPDTTPVTIVKLFDGLTADQIPSDFSLSYAVTGCSTCGTKNGTLTKANGTLFDSNGTPGIYWEVDLPVAVHGTATHNITFTESNAGIAGYKSPTFSWDVKTLEGLTVDPDAPEGTKPVITVTNQYEPDNTMYVLSYDGMGGINCPATQYTNIGSTNEHSFQVAGAETEIKVPTHPEGYEFLGWSKTETNQNVDYRYNSTSKTYSPATITLTKAEPSKTLYAVWKERPHVEPNPSLEKVEKVRVTDENEVAGAPDDVEYGAVVFKSDDQTVKLLYKITVTGTAGAKYKVTDAGAEWVSGGTSHETKDSVLVITGAIAEGQTTAVIYVTKTFSASAIQNSKLTNTANLESNDPVDPENPDKGGTEGPGPGKGEGSGSSDASETRNVTINFKTDDDDPVILQDPISKDYNKGGDFEGVTVNKPTARRAAPRASADTLVIPWKIVKDGKTYVLDEVASKDALDTLASLTSVTEDVLANLIYSLDMKGTIGTDGEGTPTDTSDDIPDKYQAKVTYVADNGGSVNKATEYVTITDDSGNLTTNGKIAVSATATPDGSHNFTGWTAVKNGEDETLTGTVTAELNAVISNVQGDKNNIPAYTITASFTEQQSFPTITLKCVKAEDNAVVLGTYTVSVDPTTGAYDVYDVLPYELLDADGVHYSWTSELRYPGNLEESGTVNKGDADAEFIAIYAVDTLIDPTVPEENRPAGGGDGIRDDWQFTVNYVAINGTVAPAQTVVTKYIEYEGHFYPSSVGEAKLAQEHLPTTAPNPGFTNGTWDTDPVVDMVIEDNITFTITYEAIVIPGNRVITINRTENGVVIDSVTVTVPQGSSYTVTGTDAPDFFDLGGNHYIRTGTRPTVPAGNDNVTVSVSYAIDNIGGGTDGKGSDGIPDNQEAVVYYTTSNEVYGTVSSAYQTFNLGSANASGSIRLSNTASTTTLSRTYFSSWTQNGTVLSTGTALDVEFAVTAGSTYEVVANFGRSGGGGGGGTTGGGGGTTGGGGTGGGNTTIVDNEVPLAGDTQLNKEDHFAYVSGYEDGTVRPNNNITREEVAAIFYRLLTEESRAIYDTDVNDFSDVAASRWSNKAISTLSNAGILSGYPDGTFRPGQTITRAEFAAIAAQFDVVTENVANPFSDTTGHWAETLISYAASKGWVSGYTDGTFLPQKAITRAEAMTLINNVLDREVDEEGLLAEAKQWPDNQQGSWYYYEVLEATNSHDYTRRSEGNLVENWTAITNQ